MLQQYLRHSRGLPWLQFPFLLSFLIDVLLHLLSGYTSLIVLDILGVALLLDAMVEILYRETNISFFGTLMTILDLEVLICASLSFALTPLGEMGDPFNVLLMMYTVLHVLRRLGIDNRVLCLADSLIFTKALPESFRPIFNFEFEFLMAVLVCVHISQSLTQRVRRMGTAGVRAMAIVLLILTPMYFILTLGDYLAMSLSTVTYTLGALCILIVVPGYNLQRFFSTTPLMLSITGGDMIGAATEVVQQERPRRGIGMIVNTRPLIGIDTPWVILDDHNDDDLDTSSDSDSDHSATGSRAIFRTIRDRRTPRAIDDPIPLPPSPGEVAAAEASRRRARRYQTGNPPTTPVSDLAGVTGGQSTLLPFRWGRPTGNLPESGITNPGISRLRQRLARLARGQGRAGGTSMHNSTEDSIEGLSTTRTGDASRPITQPEFLPGSAGAEGEGEGSTEGRDEIPEASPLGSLRLPTIFPAGWGRRVATFSDTASVRTGSPPGSWPRFLGRPDTPSPPPSLPLPPLPPLQPLPPIRPLPPQPPPVRFSIPESEGQPRPRRRTPSRFVRGERIPGFVTPTMGVEDSPARPPTLSPAAAAPVAPATRDTSDSRRLRPPAHWQEGSTPTPPSLNRGQQPDRATIRRPGIRRSPLLPYTFVDPNERTPSPAIRIIGVEDPVARLLTPTTATLAPVTPDNPRSRTPTDWQFESTSVPPSIRRAQQPDRTTPTRRPRTRRPPRAQRTPPDPVGEFTNPFPSTISTSTTPSLEAQPSGSQGLAPMLAGTQATEEDVARSIASRSVRFFSRGGGGRISEDGGRVLEIAQSRSPIGTQQGNTSLPLFRQRGSAGGESSAVGGIMGEGPGGFSVRQPVEEEEEEVPFEGRGRGRARRRNLFASP
ncbi:hypothetical protein B9Z19DRAFT_1104890 [Tuber borchii]|uniref:Uncharacterized protein n=1 Tax=Tuber borchii TaxID=42251 RepID=A0A2T7A846_TUBBO|nr:hypothetical protein B9Z19DRAFT_1104890 [Tuber borchii]